MHAAIGHLLAIVGAIPADAGSGEGEARAPLVRALSGYYVYSVDATFKPSNGRDLSTVFDGFNSRTARIPHPRAHAGPMSQRDVAIDVYPIFLEAAIDHLTMSEVTYQMWPLRADAPCALADGVRAKWFEWTLAHLSEPQSTCQLLRFVNVWATRVFTREHLLTAWPRAVEAANSWSFLLCSISDVTRCLDREVSATSVDPRPSEAVYEYVSGLLARASSKGLPKATRLDVHAHLCSLWPKRFAADHGVVAAIAAQKTAPSTSCGGSMTSSHVPVARETHTLVESAAQVNDSLLPSVELTKLLAAHPNMEKSKTKEQFALLTDLVGTNKNPALMRNNGVDAALLSDPATVEQMSTLLCATWSDKAALSTLCEVFGLRLLKACEATKGACEATKGARDDVTLAAIVATFVRFVRKCPNLPSKKMFNCTQLRGLLSVYPSASLPRDVHTLNALHPLLAQAANVDDLTDYLHALMEGAPKPRPQNDAHHSHTPPSTLFPPSPPFEVVGIVQELLYEMLDKEASASKRVEWLSKWRFATPHAAALDEDVDSDAWASAGTVAAPPLPAHEARLITTEGGMDEQGQPRPVPIAPRCELFRRFGPRGHAVFDAFLDAASPAQLRDFFVDENQSARTPLIDLCRVAMRGWQPGACPAEQVDALIEVCGWFPMAFGKCAPLVYAAGTEEQVRKLLVSHVLPPLESIPRNVWHCVPFQSCDEGQLLKMVEAGVAVPLTGVDLSKLSWELQKLLVDSQADQLDACVRHAPKMGAPITGYVERVFELLQASSERLIELGDGFDDGESRVSGWNKMVHLLLVALKDRIRAGDTLHTDEQLALFRGCARPDVDTANCTILADLMESKFVDPDHIAALVKYVLGARSFHHSVRDSALRAMMRLDRDERDALHRNLLGKEVLVAEGDGRPFASTLSMQVLFSLCVTELADDVLPLVSAQLSHLSEKQWDELLTLVAEANPMSAKPHTYPRSLGSSFNERMLARYLRDPPEKRIMRYFWLFVACTPPRAVPRYLLGVLAAQRHALDASFFEALTSMSRDEFREVFAAAPLACSSCLLVFTHVYSCVLMFPRVCSCLLKPAPHGYSSPGRRALILHPPCV